MEKSVSLVCTTSSSDYREIARKNWGLTKEQMKGMHVHHHPPRHKGGNNTAEHLYVCSPSMHQYGWHNDEFFVLMAGETSGNKHGPRGRPPKKVKPNERDLQVYELRKRGLSSTQIAEKLGLTRAMAKRSYRSCIDLGLPPLPNPKTGPAKGSPQKGGIPKGYRFTKVNTGYN
jgi:hypothetical protein